MPYRYKLAEQERGNTLRVKDVSPKFLERIKDLYGEIDAKNDFFSSNLDTYYKTKEINDETGAITHSVIKLASVEESLRKMEETYEALKDLLKSDEAKNDQNIQAVAKDIKLALNKYRAHLRKFYPEQYRQAMSRLNEDDVDEISTSGGAGAYLTPFAFRKKGSKPPVGAYKSLGYKLVKKDKDEIDEGVNDRDIKAKLSDLEFDFLSSYFDGKTFHAPNPDDSSRQINNKGDWDDWKAKTIKSYGDVGVELDNTAVWFDKIKIIDKKFIDDKDSYSKGKQAYLDNLRAQGVNYGLDEIKEAIDLVHVYDKDGSIFGTGEIIQKLPNNKVKVRFDGNFMGTFRADRVKPVMEGDTYEKMAAKGKKAGNLKQGTVRKRLGIKKGEKIPLSKINKEISRLKKMDKDKDKAGVQLGDKNQKYYKALQLSKTLKTTTNVNEEVKVGDILTKDGRKGKVVKVMDDMANVDFGNGDVYGITFRRIKGNKIVNENVKNPGASLGPGPKAGPDGVTDNYYVKGFKYKLVPKNKKGTYVQKDSGLEVKKLF